MNPLDATAVERAAAHEPPWRTERRQSAFDLFDKLSPPDSAEELWRYVDLDFALEDFALVQTPGSAGSPGVSAIDASRRLVVVDGEVVDQSGDGRVAGWVGALRTAPDDVVAAAEAAAARGVPADLDLFAAAHGSFASDAAIVHATRSNEEHVVVIDVVAGTDGAVSFPGVIVIAEDAAQASVIVNLQSSDDVDALVVPRLEVVIGQAANVKISVVQGLGRRTRSIAHARATVGRDANLVLAEAGLGGALSRLHLTVDLEGRGSSADVIGAYFGDRDQVLDYRYFMHHAGMNTRSDMFLKGAVEDEALSVFTGMIRIDESAQRTDAYQTNRNLILSEGAAAQSVPNLEILANDVRCGHGSTVGPLDEEQRYYLMSRGLDPERADRLQVRGFFGEALDRFPHEGLAGPLGERINAKFIAAQEEGRL